MQIEKLSHYRIYNRWKWGIKFHHISPTNYINEVGTATQNVSTEIAILHKEKDLSKENTQTGTAEPNETWLIKSSW